MRGTTAADERSTLIFNAAADGNTAYARYSWTPNLEDLSIVIRFDSMTVLQSILISASEAWRISDGIWQQQKNQLI